MVPVRRLLGPLLGVALVAGCRSRSTGRSEDVPAEPAPADGERTGGRLVILALDGVDPDWLEGWITQRRLPGFERLRDRGSTYWLRTTRPPTCEAAWTTMVTGLPPPDSGVFGPLRRDPATRRPAPGAVDVDLGTAPPTALARRSGTAFWKDLADGGIRVRVLWAPYEIPPEPIIRGEALAGVGVPPIAAGGGAGVLLGPEFREATPGAARDRLPLVPGEGKWTGELPGPPVPGTATRRMAAAVEVRFIADVEPDMRRFEVMLQAGSGEAWPGAWTAPLPLRFAGRGVRVEGLARFLQLTPGESPLLLVAPVEIDPAQPWLPVSAPEGYAPDLARRHAVVPLAGPVGATRALENGLIPEESFVAAWIEDLQARREVLLAEFERGGFDLFVAFLPTAEPMTRGLYRLLDPSSAGHDPARAEVPSGPLGGARLRDGVLATYAYLDDIVARVLDALAPDDVLVVLSDHGFHPVRRVVHLNAWLRREGLLVLRRGDPLRDALGTDAGRPWGPNDVDWTRTQAYAVGYGAIYLNLQGREPGGIVEPGDRSDAIQARIASKLEAWTDRDAGDVRPVRRVLVRGRDFSGRRDAAMPDVMVALEPGYRTSEETASGLIPEEPIVPNPSVLSADHVDADAEGTEGVLITTRPLVRPDPALEDIAATALGFFGVPDTSGRRDRDLWNP